MRRTNIWAGGVLLAIMMAIALLSPYLVAADPRALS
ncbi:MAG: ABC transporter permease, partial [Alphaproteobacteria bacterium]|nr:ABC transporter permease [Alphaproteobacteria bacterium]